MARESRKAPAHEGHEGEAGAGDVGRAAALMKIKVASADQAMIHDRAKE